MIMGNTESISSSGNGGSTAEEFQIGEQLPKQADIHRLWTSVHSCSRGTFKGTLFIKQFDNCNKDSKKYFENGVKYLRQLRHPCVLHYVDSSRCDGSVRLFSERIQVRGSMLELLDLCIDTLTPIEMLAGLWCILESLLFLHQTAQISHNAVCPSSIFVASSEGGCWRLGGFEFARPLIECLSALAEASTLLTASPPSARPSLQDCAQLPAFQNVLSKMEQFFRLIQTKEDEEKEEFFRRVTGDLRRLPPRVVAARLIRPLLSRCVMMDSRAHEQMLPALFRPAPEGILSTELIRSFLVPECLRIFRVRDRTIRTALLKYFPMFAEFLSPQQLHTTIIDEVFSLRKILSKILSNNQLMVGLEDIDNKMVSSSLSALSHVVRLIGADSVVPRMSSVSRKGRSLFSDGTPKSMAVQSMKCPSGEEEHLRAGRSLFSRLETALLQKSNTKKEPLEESVIKSPLDWAEEEENDWSEGWDEEEESNRSLEEGTFSAKSAHKQEGEKGKVAAKEEAPFAPLRVQETSRNFTEKELGSEFDVKLSSKGAKQDELEEFLAELEPKIQPAGSFIDRLTILAEEVKSEVKESRHAVAVEESRHALAVKESRHALAFSLRLAFDASAQEEIAGDAWTEDSAIDLEND